MVKTEAGRTVDLAVSPGNEQPSLLGENLTYAGEGQFERAGERGNPITVLARRGKEKLIVLSSDQSKSVRVS